MKRVLVCDDDSLLVDLLDFRLSSRGYDVATASNGAEALAQVEDKKPDAIILDAMMPVRDGYDVLRKLRACEDTRSIPVLMLTARRQEKDVLGALELGANDFMAKPFMPEELIARLARLIGA
jgi:DNA-binding response OmpR family regulator